MLFTKKKNCQLYIVNGQEMNKKEMFCKLRKYCKPSSRFNDPNEALNILRMHGVQCEEKKQ